MKVAVVGGGPGGCLLAYDLARDGARVSVFDASHPREKPCGGGLTARSLALLPPSPKGDPLPARGAQTCGLETSAGTRVEVSLPHEMAVASRLEFDGWLLRRAVDAGARHLSERVIALGEDRTLRTTGSSHGPFDCVVGADGANSLVRRSFLPAIPPSRRMIAAGWFAPGDAPLTVRFLDGLEGYLWVFPRPDHVGVGICAPLAQVPTRALVERLEREVARSLPALAGFDEDRYAHTIPSPSEDPASILEIAQDKVALVGDAGGLADPITGEGIYFALRSAQILAATLRETGACLSYPARVMEDFGRELLKAAAVRKRFYAPGFPERLVGWSARSPSLQGVLGDLVMGEQGYLTLKRRLLGILASFLWENLRRSSRGGAAAAARVRAGAPAAPGPPRG